MIQNHQLSKINSNNSSKIKYHRKMISNKKNKKVLSKNLKQFHRNNNNHKLNQYNLVIIIWDLILHKLNKIQNKKRIINKINKAITTTTTKKIKIIHKIKLKRFKVIIITTKLLIKKILYLNKRNTNHFLHLLNIISNRMNKLRRILKLY